MLYASDHVENFEIDYKKKLKVLIAVSGELRCFNRFTHRNLKFFKEKLQSMYYDVTIVGHTWEHCGSIDNEHLNLFDALEVTDQKVIDDWVMEDFVTRCPNPAFDSFKITEPNKPINITSRKSIANSLKLARYSWGQHWSAFASFKKYGQNKFKNRKNPGFDILIRWRWDGSFSYNYYTRYKPKDEKFEATFFEVCFDYINAKIRQMNYPDAKPFGATDGTGGIWSNEKDCFLPIQFSAPILNDRFMIFNHRAALALMNTDFPYIMDELLKHSERRESYEGHTLWYTILLNLGISMVCDLPIFTALSR